MGQKEASDKRGIPVSDISELTTIKLRSGIDFTEQSVDYFMKGLAAGITEGWKILLVRIQDDDYPSDKDETASEDNNIEEILLNIPPEPSNKKNVYSNPNLKRRVEVAQWKLNLIAPARENYSGFKSKRAYYTHLSTLQLKKPDGNVIRYGPKTFQKWDELYTKHGLEGLMQKERSDIGESHTMGPDIYEQIKQLRQEYPKANAKKIWEKLLEREIIPKGTNVCTVQRFIKNHDLRGANVPGNEGRRAFEMDAFGKLWQTDTCKMCCITINKEAHWIYVIGILDDHSRYIVGIQCFFEDTALNFQIVFKDAIARHGIPAKLFTDNGAPYSNEQLSFICGNLGTALIHTRVRDGAAKGKIERFWRTLQDDLLAFLQPKMIDSLETMNILVLEWVRNYNTRKHSAINAAPISRINDTTPTYSIRKPVSLDWLNDSFHNFIERKVRGGDCYITIDNVRYDVAPQFHGQKVIVRFVPGHLAETGYILKDNQKYPIVLQDLHANGKAKRNKPSVKLDYSIPYEEETHEIKESSIRDE